MLTKTELIRDVVAEDTTRKKDMVRASEMYAMSEAIKKTSKRVEAMKTCRNVIKYAIAFADKSDTSITAKKLLQINTCKNRFCPGCQKAKAINDALDITTLSRYLTQEKKYRPLFITLTIPNVTGDELDNAIRKMNKDIDKLFKRKYYQENMKAWIVKLEVTRNKENNTYHPHFHILAFVHKSYFYERNADNFISIPMLRKDWQEVSADERITQVDIRKAKGRTKADREKAVLELAKYTAKSSDFLDSQEVFDTMYNALKGKQVIRFCGELSVLKKVYDFDKYGLFEKYAPKTEEMPELTHRLQLDWNKDVYEKTVNELNEDEKKELARTVECETDKDFADTYFDNLHKLYQTEQRIEMIDTTDANEIEKEVLENELKNLKRKKSECKRKLTVMEYVAKNMYANFKFKEFDSEYDFLKAMDLI